MLRVICYGLAKRAGTSANIQAIVAGLRHYWKMEVAVRDWPSDVNEQNAKVVLTECKHQKELAEALADADIFIMNLSTPNQEMEEVWFRHSLVRKNVIFLIGKYYQEKENELKKLATMYRIPETNVCAIPYNPRFGLAYEKGKVLDYLQHVVDSGQHEEDIRFKHHLKQVLDTIVSFGKKKGDVYYG